MANGAIEYIPRGNAKPIDISDVQSGTTANDSGTDSGDIRESKSDGGIPLVDPVTGDRIGDAGNDSDSGPSDGDGEPARKRRGRPKGYKLGPRVAKETPRSASLAGIEQLLLSIHGIAAATLNIEELELMPAEAKSLTEAINGVAKHYPVGMSEKTLAWANLGIVAIGVYGTRVAAYGIRKKMEKQRKIPSGPQAVRPGHVQDAGFNTQATGSSRVNSVNGIPNPPVTRPATGSQMVEPITEFYQTPPRD